MNRYKLLAWPPLSGVMGAASAETTLTVTPRWKPTRSRPIRPRSKANPDIKIQWVRDSTGIITAKLLAEKNNPRPTPSGAWPAPRWA